MRRYGQARVTANQDGVLRPGCLDPAANPGQGDRGSQPNLSAQARQCLERDITALLPALRGFARFLARDQVLADDLVQDAVLRAFNAIDQFQPGTNLKAWLFTILRNHFYEQARRTRREHAVMAEYADTGQAAVASPHAQSEIADLQVLIFRLSPLLREALILVGAQGLSHEEAAAICGVPVGTMKARLSRARTQLVAMAG